jgi:hypothetical protein
MSGNDERKSKDGKSLASTAFPVGKSGNPGGWGAEKLRNYRELARKVRDCTDDGARIVRLCGRFLTVAEKLTDAVEKEFEPTAAGDRELTRAEVRELSGALREIATATMPVVKEMNDRGWGKAVQTIDLNVDAPRVERESPKWEGYSDDEKRLLLEAADKLAALTDDEGDGTAPTEH